MFGLLEIHGPISAIFDNDGATIAEVNPYSWARKANMIYIDNPVGAGYSYTSSDNLPTGQESIGEDLYEFLIQWFKLFPQYQGNEFFPFGESYAGTFQPNVNFYTFLSAKLLDLLAKSIYLQVNSFPPSPRKFTTKTLVLTSRSILLGLALAMASCRHLRQQSMLNISTRLAWWMSH